jgi:hypothetical protein
MPGHDWLWMTMGILVWIAWVWAVMIAARAARGTMYERRYARHAYPDPKARERSVTPDSIGSMIYEAERQYWDRGAGGEVVVADFGGWISGPCIDMDPPGEDGHGGPPSPSHGGPGESEPSGATAHPDPSPGQEQGFWEAHEDPREWDDWDERALRELAEAPACGVCGSLFVWTHYDDGTGHPSRYGPGCGHDDDVSEPPGREGDTYVPLPVMGAATREMAQQQTGTGGGSPPAPPSRLLADTGTIERAALLAQVVVEMDRQDREAREYVAKMAEDATAYRLALIGGLT